MNAQNVKLAIAPIGWTNDDLPELGQENSFEQCISEMALAGFVGCEVGSKYPRDLPQLKKALELRGLQVCNAWFSSYFANGERQKTLEQFIAHRDFLHQLGAKVIGCSEQSGSIQGTDLPLFGLKPQFTEQQWQATFDGYNQLAELAAEKGMKVCLHHHMGTGIQTRAEIDRFMQGVNDDVYLLFDSGHAYYAENSQQAMQAILADYLPRIIHVHLKDVRNNVMAQVKQQQWSFLTGVKQGVFTVPGDGDIDFAPLFHLLAQHDYQGWLVVEAEQDPALANPFEYALKARRYIKQQTDL